MDSDMRFEDQVAVVTGAGRGSDAPLLCASPPKARVWHVSVGRRKTQKKPLMKSTSSGVNQQRRTQSMSQIMRLCKKSAARMLEDFGRADILVNNAGMTRDVLAMRMSLEDWDASSTPTCEARLVLSTRYSRDDQAAQRSNRQYQFCNRSDGQRRADKLRGEQSRLDRFNQIARARIGQPQYHSQCRGAGICHNRHDRRAIRSS